MALVLKTVTAARGAHWVRDAMRLYLRRPLAFTAVFIVYLLAVLLAVLVPFVGAPLQAALLPLLTLGMMVVSQSALLDGPVAPGQIIDVFRGPPARRRALLVLCLAYAAAVMATFWLGDAIAGGSLTKLYGILPKNPSPEEVDALLAQRPLAAGALFVFVALSALSVPFWHAPALVHWGGQGAWQALFSSTLAVWRCRGAFVIYALTWFALTSTFVLVSGLVLSIAGTRALATLAVPAAMLFFSTLFYISLIFTFNDSFGPAAAPPLPETMA